jgi:hypothetical protein
LLESLDKGAGWGSLPASMRAVERLHQCGSGYSLIQGEYQHRQRDRAHYRFISAVKALATVRRLAMPVLMARVNVTNRQVNVMPSPNPSPRPRVLGGEGRPTQSG